SARQLLLPVVQRQPGWPSLRFHLTQIVCTTELPALLTDPLAATQGSGGRACCTPAARGRQHGGQLGGPLVVEHRRRYTEVVPRRGLDAEHTRGPPDDLQVYLADPLLGPERLHGQGEPGLQPLAWPAAPGPEDQVLGDLLAQGAGAAQTAAALVVLHGGADGLQVEAMVLGKALVLGGNHRHLDVVRYLPVGDPVVAQFEALVTPRLLLALDHQQGAGHRHPAQPANRGPAEQAGGRGRPAWPAGGWGAGPVGRQPEWGSGQV